MLAPTGIEAAMRMIQMTRSTTGHSAPITHVDFRRDGRRLTTCSYDGTAVVWDTTEPTQPVPVTRLKHRRLINSSAWNPADPRLLATASADKTAAVWRISHGGPAELVTVLARHTDDINSIAWMPAGDHLICVSEDGRATMWEAGTGAFVTEVGSHATHCMMVSVSSRGLVATVGEDGMVSVSEPGSGAGPVVRRYDSSVEGCAWSHAADVLAVTRDDGCVDLLSPTLERLRTVQASTSAARAVSWADDDSSFVVGGYDGSLHFFDPTATRTHRIADPRIWPRSVSVARGLVAAGSFWNSPHILDLGSARELAAPAEATHGPNALGVLDDNLLAGCDSGAVLAVGLPGTARRPEVRPRQVTQGPILSMVVRAGKLYLGTFSGHVVRENGARLRSEHLGAPVPALCLDGDVLVAGTYNGELLALDPDTLAVLDRRQAHGGSIKSLAALPGGGFVSGSTDRTVAAGPFGDRTTLWQHGNLVNSVAVLPGCGERGTVVASAARDHTVKAGRLVPTADGGWRADRLQTLLGPDESVKCVGLLGDADAPSVVAGSYDFGLYGWEVDWQDGAAALSAGRLLAEFRQGLSCMVSLGPRHLAAAGWDGRVVIVGNDGPGDARVLSSIHLQDLPWI